MHLYWRVIEELEYLGEKVQLRDPNLSREYISWLQKKSTSLNMLSGPQSARKLMPLEVIGTFISYN